MESLDQRLTDRFCNYDKENDPATIHKILEFGENADLARNQTIEEAESESFYNNPRGQRSALNGRFKKLEMDLTDEFRERVIQPAKQDLISREGPL